MNSAITNDSLTKTGLLLENSKKYPYNKNLAKFNIIFTRTMKEYQFSDSEFQNLASQSSHLILNKMFSYYVIQAQVHKQYGIKLENLFDISSKKTFQDQIKERFEDIINTFEIAPIFQTDIFDEIIQFSENLSKILQDANKFFINLHIENLNEDIIS
ncbi:MAG: hypothetical protein ACTSPA_01980, partial [Promethearchaeota archaeon]